MTICFLSYLAQYNNVLVGKIVEFRFNNVIQFQLNLLLLCYDPCDRYWTAEVGTYHPGLMVWFALKTADLSGCLQIV